MPRLVIKRHRPWQWTIAITMLSMAIALLTFLMLDNSYWRILRASIGEVNNQQTLQKSNRDLEVENRELTNRILMLEQTTRLDKETAVMLQGEMVDLQNQIYHLKQELEFYRGVMDAARKTVGMDVHDLYIEPVNGQNRFIMKLVLTHVSKNDTVVKGSLNINIEGIQNGERRRLNLASLCIDDDVDFGFEIKSFKRLEYRFELADGFVADQVVVRIEPKTGGESVVSETYDWPLL